MVCSCGGGIRPPGVILDLWRKTLRTSCPECHCVFDTEPPPSRFRVPTVQEVTAYCQARGNAVDPQGFLDFYESKGWMIGKNRMKSWEAAVRTWERDTKIKEKIAGPVCPLCKTYRLTGNEIICSRCGPHCRRCGVGTARLVVCKRKDATLTAVCHDCISDLRGQKTLLPEV